MGNKNCLFWLMTVFMPLVLAAADCAVCGNELPARYIKTAQADYCSKDCYYSTMPKCDYCKEPCTKHTFKMVDKIFCSKRCLYKVFRCSICDCGLEQFFSFKDFNGKDIYFCRRCSKLPPCYFCDIPTARKADSDGKNVCQSCRKSAVNDPQEVRRIFNRVRQDMNRMFGYDPKHKIILNIVNVPTLNDRSKSVYMPAGGKRLALMHYQNQVQIRKYPNGREERKIVNEKCQIFILRGVPRVMLYDAFAHELTHDYIRHHVGNVKNLASEEGFCELIAFLYNKKLGNTFLNSRKERNTDPVYGEGFRSMRGIYRRTGSFQKTLKYVR